ncbi:MAG: right-handed parallel beta-helix repeat-containing protein [Segetibacter sp.]|nr:right-handed parallel beta-helix repeat-containing protein [Segetibacter sp.]
MLLLLYFAVMSTVEAKLRRVGFIATIMPVNGLDYGNFQAAHDASAVGDTIQLYPNTTGSVTYSGTISKQVVIIGPGYFTNSYYLSGAERANAGLQNLAGSIASCSFTIDLGSAGAIIQGLNNVSINTIDRVDALNNINIRRCRGVSISFINSGQCNDWTISQCYGVTTVQTGTGSSATNNRTINRLSISNSVIYQQISLATSPTGTYTGNTIYNCNFISGASLSLNGAAFTIQNSIFEGQSFTGVTNVAFVKNITNLSATSNPMSTNAGSSGNTYNVAMSNVYVNYPTYTTSGGVNVYSPDGRFQLKTGTTTNPAINGGYLPGTTTPTNSGIYGGVATDSYVLSGIPPIPVYYQLTAPSAVTVGSNYTITFSVRNNN